MKLLKQKKGMIMVFFLSILIVIIIMPMLFFTLYNKQAHFEKTLGSIQIDLIQTYQSAEQDLFYIDQSAKYSAAQTAYELADNGGFHFPSPCGKFPDSEYQLWNEKDKECYPNYELNFKTRLTNNLNDYFNAKKLPQPGYEFSIINQNIIGIASENIIYKLENGNYSVKPSFNINIGYDIDEYQNIVTQARQLVEKCSTADIQNCIKQNLPAGFIFGSCEGDQTIKDRKTRFCIISSTKISLLNPITNNIESTNIKYKFALYFPEQPQQ